MTYFSCLRRVELASSKRSRLATFCLALLTLLAITPRDSRADEFLTLQKGDRICLVGNAQAERLQQFGFFETRLHTAFPQLELVVRNLGWSADELTLRPRSLNFGTQDDYLNREQADVILAFFGFNESFAGPDGLEKFKKDLTDFIHHVRGQHYNGESAPRLALVSPLPHENLHDSHLPDGQANNQNIALYTKAMSEVAKAEGVPLANLFDDVSALMRTAGARRLWLTTNGVHLNASGSQQVAPILMAKLFGKEKAGTEIKSDSPLLAAVNDKSLHFFHHYRAVNGYYIYGGRSKLWENDKVMETERKKLNDMVALRDRYIWDLAQGKTPTPIDDTRTTPLMEVESNYKQPIKYLMPEESVKKFNIPDGFEVNIFASEQEFPELKNPVQMTFDARGRLWVCTMPSYPQYQPPGTANDMLLIFEDTDGDGRADKRTVFADKLHVPTGFELGHGGVFIAQQPNLMFLKDNNGDDVADERRVVLHGFDSGDSHHSIGAFTWGPGGALYFQEGIFHHSQIETPHGPVRLKDAGVFRYEPKTEKFEVFVSYPFANPWGHIFDAWGQNFVADASGGSNYFGTAFSGHVEYPRKHRRMKEFFHRQYRPTAGCEIVSSRNFPDDMQGNFLLNNCIGFLGIANYKFKEDGSGLAATDAGQLLRSDDPNFRPVDLEFGPDGALYFVDWYNPLVGHMQHSLRDPKRDHRHGRVWRMRYKNKPLVKKPTIAGASIPELLELLKSPEIRTRYRARRELAMQDEQQVAEQLATWVANLTGDDAEHSRLEALWIHQYIDVVNEPLLRSVLSSPEPRARAAATRVLCYWRDRVDSAIDLLTTQAGDENARVRLEAVRAASYFQDPRAADIVVEALIHPQDYYLRYTIGETLTTLGQHEFGLVRLLRSGRLEADRIGFVVELACKRGGGEDLGYLYDRTIQAEGFPADVRLIALNGLFEAATIRRVRPQTDLAPISELVSRLRQEKHKPSLMAAIRLIRALQVRQAEPGVIDLALDESASLGLRKAALDVLVAFDTPQGREAIDLLASNKHPAAVRFMAIAALVNLDLEQATEHASKALIDTTSAEDPAPLVQAFLAHPEGAQRLAAGLTDSQLDSDVAKLVLRAMYALGRSDAQLTDVLTEAAKIETQSADLSEQEIAQLESDVREQGDAVRGELVFRRADLSCMSCHSLAGVGGGIGPELTAVGSSSPVRYLINAILTPEKEVKEAYQMASVLTSDGRDLHGLIHEETDDRLVLKDATGKRTVIPKSDFEEEDLEKGGSLMPKGLVQFMTRRELVDLVRFLSELGRDGDYKIVYTPTIRRWRVLVDVPTELSESIPNVEVLTDRVLDLDATAWRPAYSLSSGVLPLDNTLGADGDDVVYLQFEIEVAFAGELDFIVDSADGLTIWNGDKLLSAGPDGRRYRAEFGEGTHKVTVRLDRRQREANSLRIDAQRTKDTRLRARLVDGV